MADAIKTYSPKDLQLVLAGSYIVGGVVSLTASFPTPHFKVLRSTDGRNIRVRQRDTSCLLTVELLQTSTANDVFSSILSQDIATGLGRLSVSLADLSGSTRIGSANGFIVGYPELHYSGELATRLWNIQLLDTTYIVVGGNSMPRPKFLEDILGFLSGTAGAVGDFTKSAINKVAGLF